VRPIVVIVAEAFAGGVTVDGLTVQTGVSVKFVGVTWQPRSTVPLKPLRVPTVMLEDEVPPGATASGENGVACSVAWADAADDKVNKAPRHRAAIPACRVLSSVDFEGLNEDANDDQNFDSWDFNAFDVNDPGVNDPDVNDSGINDSDLTMSRFRFK
jgi:hypothetical protein